MNSNEHTRAREIEKKFLPLNKEVFERLMDKSMEEVIDKFGEDAHPPKELGELIFDNFLCRLGDSGYNPAGGGWWHTQWDGEKLQITAPDGAYMGAIGPDSVSRVNENHENSRRRNLDGRKLFPKRWNQKRTNQV